MSDIIQLLPEHVANQIAAGEVVQRPASVVKELLENALDAGADHIKLLFKDAGKTLIQVIDNGKGMSQTDARMCFERHATSKIKKTEDLFHIQTNGFRGEALASIAAVAQVELRTKQPEDELGVQINIEGSKVSAQEPVATPQGTSIAVKNLFYNIPARRNFLKSDTSETRHIINEFQRVALCNPTVHFFAQHNDVELYNLPVCNLKKRIVDVFGKKINEKLVPIQEKTGFVSIDGYIVKSEYTKKTRGEQFFFVNNRYIRSDYLNHAVKKAYEGLIAQDRHPGYFLFLEVDPSSIDINIHPTKTEIKFENESDLYAVIYATVKRSLGQYQVAPVLDFEHDPTMDLPYEYKDKLPHKEPEIKVDRAYNPFKDKNQPSWEALYTDVKDSSHEFPVNDHTTETQELFVDEQTTYHKTQQIQNKYILSTIKSGLVFIHQNRAHQRILYEDFLTKLSAQDSLQSQQLLFPVQIDFDQNDIRTLKTTVEYLMQIGFTFETIQEDHIILNGLPAGLDETRVQQFLEHVIEATQQDTLSEQDAMIDVLAQLLAGSSAVRVGQTLDPKAQEALVDNLFNCKEPHISPSGKPSFTTLTIEDIDKRL